MQDRKHFGTIIERTIIDDVWKSAKFPPPDIFDGWRVKRGVRAKAVE
jgi:hypothetical protein